MPCVFSPLIRGGGGSSTRRRWLSRAAPRPRGARRPGAGWRVPPRDCWGAGGIRPAPSPRRPGGAILAPMRLLPARRAVSSRRPRLRRPRLPRPRLLLARHAAAHRGRRLRPSRRRRPPRSAPAAPDPAPPPLRLPGDVRPVRYALDLTIVPDRERASGKVGDRGPGGAPDPRGLAERHGASIDRATLAGKPARVIPGGDDFVGLAAAAELPAGLLAIEVARSARRSIARRAAGSTPSARAPTPTRTRSSSRSTRGARSLLRRAGVQGALAARRSTSRQEHVALAQRAGRARGAGGRRHEARRASRRRGRCRATSSRSWSGRSSWWTAAPRAGRATPLRFIIPKGRGGRAALRRAGHAARGDRARGLLRHGVPVRQARRGGGAPVLGHDGAPGHRRDGPAADADPPGRGDASRRQALHEHRSRTSWRTTGSATCVTMAWWDDTWLNESLGAVDGSHHHRRGGAELPPPRPARPHGDRARWSPTRRWRRRRCASR